MSKPEHFFNPYTFVRTPPRDLADPITGDHVPVGHAGGPSPTPTYTGHVTVRLTAQSPILLPDQARPQKPTGGGPPAMTMRRTPDGRALLSGSSIKGMLRSTYEALTNSRFGVFADDQPLTYRIRRAPQGGLLWGLVVDQPSVSEGATLRIITPLAVEGRLAMTASQHQGKCITVAIRKAAKGYVAYDRADTLDHQKRAAAHCVSGYLRGVSDKGRATWRFCPLEMPGQDVKEVSADARVIRLYQATVLASQEHQGGKVDLGRPYAAGKLAQDYLNLAVGTAVRVELNADRLTVKELRTAVQGITTTQWSPLDFTPDDVLPPRALEEFSPAERLFGAITQSEDGHGYRGHIRVRQAEVDDAPSVHSFGSRPLPLAPLSSPRRQPAGFYFADLDQEPQAIALEHLNPKKHRIRGRKAYLTHRAMADDDDARHRWSPDSARAHLARGWNPAKGSKSVRSDLAEWISPRTTFVIRIDVTAAPEPDLVPLLWILRDMTSRDGGTPLQVGMGKPYGFGTVTIELDPTQSALFDNAALESRWLAPLDEDDVPAIPTCLSEAVDAFTPEKTPVEKHVLDLLTARQGQSAECVHYPRLRTEGGGYKPGFAWFDKAQRPVLPLATGKPLQSPPT